MAAAWHRPFDRPAGGHDMGSDAWWPAAGCGRSSRRRIHLEDHKCAGDGGRGAGRVRPVGGDAMTDERDLPRTSAEARELMNRIAFDPPMTPEEEAELLATLPPTGSVVMVVRSLRLPMEMDEAVSAAARAADVPKSTWI